MSIPRPNVSKFSFGFLLFTMFFVCGLPPAFAQDKSENKLDDTFLKNLEFRSIGPANMGGRIDDIAVVENNPSTFYVGAATGGLWKTTNNGTTFEPIFDAQSSTSIGDIAIAPSDASIIWVGSGEPNNRQSSSWGDGVYRSLDAGKTWTNMGLRDTKHIARVVIDSRDPSIVYVAALGHLWGPNKERGVFKTTDAGKTWTNVLFINEDTGVTDLAIDPESPLTLYAAAYQRRRRQQCDLQNRRRRCELDQADEGSARRHHRPHRSRHLSAQPEHRLRPRREQ
jgi:Neuraminidase (sialidase)